MEELKLILTAIGSVGEAGKWMYIAFLAKDLLIYLLGYFFGGLVCYWLYKFGISAYQHNSFISDITNELGTYGPLTVSEKKKVLDKLRG